MRSATFRCEHDRNSDKALLLSGLASEPAFSGKWCVVGGIEVGFIEVKRPQRLHHVQDILKAQDWKGALCDKVVFLRCSCSTESYLYSPWRDRKTHELSSVVAHVERIGVRKGALPGCQVEFPMRIKASQK